jgi:hypothetical protein
MRLLFISIITFFILFACSNDKENLPPASGLSGDMYLVMDSTQWEGPLGDVIDSLFRIEMDCIEAKAQSNFCCYP